MSLFVSLSSSCTLLLQNSKRAIGKQTDQADIHRMDVEQLPHNHITDHICVCHQRAAAKHDQSHPVVFCTIMVADQ